MSLNHIIISSDEDLRRELYEIHYNRAYVLHTVCIILSSFTVIIQENIKFCLNTFITFMHLSVCRCRSTMYGIIFHWAKTGQIMYQKTKKHERSEDY